MSAKHGGFTECRPRGDWNHVDIARLAHHLLRTHVRQRADQLPHSGRRDGDLDVRVGHAGHAEVKDLRLRERGNASIGQAYG